MPADEKVLSLFGNLACQEFILGLNGYGQELSDLRARGSVRRYI